MTVVMVMHNKPVEISSNEDRASGNRNKLLGVITISYVCSKLCHYVVMDTSH